jgi:thioredoxin reductase (NADPH)
MHDVLVVGDGPGGLSCALLLAKSGRDVVVFGGQQTPMHKALLRNYLGFPEISGAEFLRIARAQVAGHGARMVDEDAVALTRGEEGFSVTGRSGAAYDGRYLVLAIADTAAFAQLGMQRVHGTWDVDLRSGRTNVPRLYAQGWAVRKKRIQAVISAGDGAAIALDILSTEAGRDINDFDVVSP